MRAKRIAVVTGSRSEYGLLHPLLVELAAVKRFEVLIVATASHLDDGFGATYREIEEDGFSIAAKVELDLGDDTPQGMARAIGACVAGCADALTSLSPDLVILLGDRYEALAAAIAAFVLGLPIAHLHGGELTEGALDDAMRHAITKMSVLHLTSTDEYRRRVIQLGEEPDRVYDVGALGVDNVAKTALISKDELERTLGFELRPPSILVTFHPVTTEPDGGLQGFQNLLGALRELARDEDVRVLFTRPNADPHNRRLLEAMDAFVGENPTWAAAATSLGRARYLSAVAVVDAVAGNSSSGIIEVPSLGKPSVNIGDRQKGRVRPASVIDCEPGREAILHALKEALSPRARARAGTAESPYGDGHAAERIAGILQERIDDLGGIRKRFYDLPACPPAGAQGGA